VFTTCAVGDRGVFTTTCGEECKTSQLLSAGMALLSAIMHRIPAAATRPGIVLGPAVNTCACQGRRRRHGRLPVVADLVSGSLVKELV